MTSILWSLALSAAHAQSGSPWDATLERVTQAVVAIKMDVPRAFDGKGRANSQATGFVIDAEKGLILTNRHVVTPGPVKAKGIFFDKEEVVLTPVYRDPVHDFGLYSYDPEALEHMEPPALELSPERARVGLEVRVVGNDGGDQLQILDGTLARLDRAAPRYGSAFNDFNTFYFQAASATSGGSSGSPVVDVDGHVVAINAGGSGRTASSYYLPLDRVVRAVDLLTEGDTVSRGTLQTTVVQAPFDELARMQVADDILAAARERDPEGTGLLVVRAVLPGGPAEGALEVGDVVLFVGDDPVHDHVTLEGALDANVGQDLTLKVARGPEVVDVSVTVQDLHGITPDRFLEVGGGVIHPLSYHQARVMQTHVRGMSIAELGYVFKRAGLPKNAVIVEVEEVPVTTLEKLDQQLGEMAHGQPFRLRYYERGRPQETFLATAVMDRDWFDQRLCVRDDPTGTWPCTDSTVTEASWSPPKVAVTLPEPDDKLAARLQPSLVRLEVRVPYQIAGNDGEAYQGVGIVVGDGLLLTDRDTVVEALADVTVLVGGVARLPAEVVALHPVHNLALIRFDPSLVAGTELTPVTFRESFTEGDEVFYVGLDHRDGVNVRDADVESLVPLRLPDDGSPRYRQVNLDLVTVHPSAPLVPGVLVDKKGRVGALWSSFAYTKGRDNDAVWGGMGTGPIQQLLAVARGESTARTLPWELVPLPLDRALQLGLPPAKAEALLAADPDNHVVFGVGRVMAGSPLADAVEPGDLVLGVDGAPVTSFSVVDEQIQGRSEVTLELFGRSGLAEVAVAPEAVDPVTLDRVVLWSGLRIHGAHRSARLQGMASCPYVSYRSSGSPGSRAGIYAWRCIVAINGQPTPTLDALLEIDATLAEGEPVRVDLVTLEGRKEVRTLELHRAFWPTVELSFREGAWKREVQQR